MQKIDSVLSKKDLEKIKQKVKEADTQNKSKAH